MRGAHARGRFEGHCHYRRLVGVAGFLFFTWLGYRQSGTAFLGIFVICLVTLMPTNWVLYNKIYQDLDWM